MVLLKHLDDWYAPHTAGFQPVCLGSRLVTVRKKPFLGGFCGANCKHRRINHAQTACCCAARSGLDDTESKLFRFSRHAVPAGTLAAESSIHLLGRTRSLRRHHDPRRVLVAAIRAGTPPPAGRQLS